MAVYYIDFTNGSDLNDGLSPSTAWQTLNTYTNATRSPGDKCWVRNGGTHPTITANIEFFSDGTPDNPIIVEADDGTQWTADKTTLTNTYTLTYGSDTVTASATETQLTAGKQVYFGTENDKIYEVLSVLGTSITIWPPYRGDLSGSGNSGTMLPAKPLIDFGTTSYYMHPYGDLYWVIKRLDMKGGNTGVMYAYSSAFIFDGCVFRESTGINGSGAGVHGYASFIGCRFYQAGTGYQFYLNSDHVGIFDDVLFDGNNSTSYGVRSSYGGYPRMYNVIFRNHTSADLEVGSSSGATPSIIGRNVKFESFSMFHDYTWGVVELAFEDFQGTVGDNRVFSYLDETINIATLQSDTTIVRPGGSDKSIKCIGSSRMSPASEFGRIKLLEAVYYQPAAIKTYTVYFNLPAAEFLAAPTADELYLELEYFETSTARKKKRSTGTIIADGTWQSLSVTATNAIAGQVYLRAYYCKTKETNYTNTFYTDPIPVVS